MSEPEARLANVASVLSLRRVFVSVVTVIRALKMGSAAMIAIATGWTLCTLLLTDAVVEYS